MTPLKYLAHIKNPFLDEHIYVFIVSTLSSKRMDTPDVFYPVQCAYDHSAHLNFATILGHYIVNPKPFLRYLPSIMCRQNFIIISFVKKCALYLIKYGK